MSVLLNPFRRFFLRYDLVLRPHYGHGVALPFRSSDATMDVESLLRDAMAKGHAVFPVQNQDVVRLTNFEIYEDKGVAALLFRRSDPGASVQIYERRPTLDLWRPNTTADDAVAISAHLFVKLAPSGGAHITHAAVLEEVPGIGRTYVYALLHDVVMGYKYNYTDRHGEEKETHTIVDMQGVTRERVGKAASESHIPYIELVRPPEIKGLDTEGLITPKEQRMKLQLNADPAKVLPLVKRVKDWAYGNKWSDVRVKIDLPENRSRLVSLSREKDAADVLFVRASPVTVKNEIPICTKAVNVELMGEAIALLK